MWTPELRRTADRNGLRYPSGLIVESMIPHRPSRLAISNATEQSWAFVRLAMIGIMLR
jgi:hypothetical protein